MKKIVSLILTVAMLLFSAAAFAQTADAQATPKEESIYALLAGDGTPTEVDAVNLLLGGGELTDYGDYAAVQNLTDTAALTQTDGRITASTQQTRFYYQGTLKNAQLPWNVHIDYTLDGKPITAQELGGRSGELQIHLAVTQNPKADPTFYLNYALQIAVSLDPALCDDIRADQATAADVAGQKQLSFIALPGQGADVTVSAKVHDFAMEPITLSGIHMSLNLNTDALTEQTTQLTDAIASLDDGAGSLQTGADSLASGLTQYLAGVKALTDGLGQLADGSATLDSGAASLRDGLTSLTAQNETLLAAAQALQQSTFDTVNAQLAQSKQKLPTLTPENYAQVLQNVPALEPIKAQLDGITQFVAGLQSYFAGVSQLSTGASTLADGTSQLSASLSGLPASATTLSDSATQLQTGADSLNSGLTDYKTGTETLRTQTSGLSTSLSDEIGSLTGNGDPVISFVSAKNTRVNAVQFALKTSAVEAPKAQAAAEPEAAPQTIWQKITALFGR